MLRIARWLLLMALAALIAPSMAVAQAPEVMLLIDGSRQMSVAPGPAPVRCAPAGTAAPMTGATYQPDSALNLVKEALVGTLRGPRWCVTEGAAARAAHHFGSDGDAPHHRAMCCHTAACDRFGPCGEDHDRGVVQARDARAGVSWDDDGLLSQFGGRIKFSLLFTDGAPSTDRGRAGHYSYGPAVDGQNLGARSAAAPTGGFVSAHRGQGADPARAVDETPTALSAHAAFVARRVRALVPHGPAPLAALIEDARIAAAEPDPLRACRPRLAILITRGRPMNSPYGPAAAAAARFRAETGAALHVIVLDRQAHGAPEQFGTAVGDAGAPALPYASTRVASLPALRTALQRLIQRPLTTQPHAARPLVLSPAAIDHCAEGAPRCAPDEQPIMQWRITASTDAAGGEAIGRLHADALACTGGSAPRRVSRLRVEEMLGARDQPRRCLGPRDGATHVYTGGAEPCFDPVGRALWPLPVVDTLLGVMGSPPADRRPERVADPGPRRRAGLLLNGYFGSNGLGQNGRQQLGAMGRGSLLALRPPSLGVASPAWQTYRARMDARPTVIITGADDGQLHVVRARDGVDLLGLIPAASLRALPTGTADAQALLDVGDLLRCRTVEGGADPNCPQDAAHWPFGAFLAGALGATVFGYDLTAADALFKVANTPLNDGQQVPGWTVTTQGAPGRPVLTHVTVSNDGTRRIRAAIAVGCGAARTGAGDGRCVLILDAATGALIRRFDANDNAQLTAPMQGDAVAFPAGSIAPAERIYIGDAIGRMWRIDTRAANPTDWRMQIAWPPPNADARGYQTGRPTVGRPSLAVRPDRGLAVLFATGGTGAAPAHWVSFTDAPRLNDNRLDFEVSGNWVMPFAPTEVATDGPTVRDGVAYLTTRTDGAGPCGAARSEGRLYGVDFVRRYVDARGTPGEFDFEGRRLEVRPALPRFENGARAPTPGLAVVLPPGRIAAGLALARTPGCGGEAATDSVVLNMANDGGPDRQGDAAVRDSFLEFVQDNRIARDRLDQQMFARSSGQQLDLCLTCQPNGAAPANPPAGLAPPFPSRLTYWGSTLMD